MGVQWFWDCTSDEFLEHVEVEGTPMEDSSIGLTVSENCGIPCIWLADPLIQGVAVHEIVHAVHSIMKSRGIQLSDATEEIYAYYQEFLFHSYQEGVLGEANKIGITFQQDGVEHKIWFTRDIVKKANKIIEKWQQTKKKKTSCDTKESIK